MSDNTITENKSITTALNNMKRRVFLSQYDIGILIFSTLIINLFSLAVPMVTLQVYDRILAFHSIGTLQVLCGGVFVVVVLDIMIRLCRFSIIGWTSARFEHTAFTNALRHLTQAKILNVHQFSHGEHLHKLSAIAKLKSFYSGQSLINLIDLPFVVIFLGFILYLSGVLVLVPLALLSMFAVYAVYLGHKMKRTLEMRDNDDDDRINFISETLENIHTVKMLGLETAFLRRHESLQANNVSNARALNENNAQSYNAAALFTQIMMISMVSIGALMVLDGQITMGILIACVLLSGRVMQPVQRALSFWMSYQEYSLAQDKMNTLFDIPVQHKMKNDALKTPKGKLSIKNLKFSYSENAPLLFNGLDLTLQAGKIIAMGGPPSDGKTTLLKLIAGLYEPTDGDVTIDGMKTCEIPSESIAKYVGYLPSEADIFQGTIIDNLTGFRPELEDQAIEIAGYLGIDKVVSKLSAGYQSQLSGGAADPLTPGMKQRITIGRVLVNKPRLILFDSADKSLDKEGYNHVFRFLGQLKGQATMILVSNDRNILHLAHKEYVVEDGKLVDMDDSRYSKSGQVIAPFEELRS